MTTPAIRRAERRVIVYALAWKHLVDATNPQAFLLDGSDLYRAVGQLIDAYRPAARRKKRRSKR